MSAAATGFQVKFGEKWSNYSKGENDSLVAAWSQGAKEATYTLKRDNQSLRYRVNFEKMTQTNLDSGKVRQIRPPYTRKSSRAGSAGSGAAPSAPSAPPAPAPVATVAPGNVISVLVPAGASPGMKIQVPRPDGNGMIIATVPEGAKEGMTIHVPVPAAPAVMAGVPYPEEKGVEGKGKGKGKGGSHKHEESGLVTGAKVVGGVAAGTAVVGGGICAGMLIGNAVETGVLDLNTAGDQIVDGFTDIGDAFVAVVEDIQEAGGEVVDFFVNVF